MQFIAKFTLIGEDQKGQTTEDLAAAAPGRVVAIDQDLFEEVGQPWGKGNPVGEAHGSIVVTGKSLGMCHITFTFGDQDTIVAHGALPLAGSTVGNGHIAVAGGTGEFDKVSGRLDVETRNPKRWSFAL